VSLRPLGEGLVGALVAAAGTRLIAVALPGDSEAALASLLITTVLAIAVLVALVSWAFRRRAPRPLAALVGALLGAVVVWFSFD
jgi:predicted membrane channel-forming protein YqfA (hemolysin III family)